MKAIVLREIGKLALEDCPEPGIQDSKDAIVRVTTAGICGSDLHIVHGRDEGIRPGTIMGHEFVGVIEEIGEEVAGFRPGDRVVAPFTINCGDCFYCKRELPARCVASLGFGFISEGGAGLHGAQAERVRVPLASSTLIKAPDRASDGTALEDEDVLFLGDIFSTAYSTAEGAGIRKGDTVVVIGCGPVGLLCILAARTFEPSNIVAVDTIEYRLQKAHAFGAIPVSPDAEKLERLVKELTDGRGADAVLEAVGHAPALDLAIHIVRPGATVSVAGYHTASNYNFPIQQAYTKNLTLRTGRCNARKYMARLLPWIVDRKVPLKEIITHSLPLSEGVSAYQIFDQRLDSAIKVLLKP